MGGHLTDACWRPRVSSLTISVSWPCTSSQKSSAGVDDHAGAENTEEDDDLRHDRRLLADLHPVEGEREHQPEPPARAVPSHSGDSMIPRKTRFRLLASFSGRGLVPRRVPSKGGSCGESGGRLEVTGTESSVSVAELLVSQDLQAFAPPDADHDRTGHHQIPHMSPKGFCVTASSFPKLPWRTHTSTLPVYFGNPCLASRASSRLRYAAASLGSSSIALS